MCVDYGRVAADEIKKSGSLQYMCVSISASSTTRGLRAFDTQLDSSGIRILSLVRATVSPPMTAAGQGGENTLVQATASGAHKRRF